jgi:nitroimidazol reductase NimA-like FMN-containing flavoprotein (pyridoxamine 5'-phosphate oxidase superfamily)
MALTSRPEFFELSRPEAVALLERNHVGRLAFTFHDRVDIEPISFVFEDRYVYGRTSPGTKVTTVQHHPWVAFEVDEVEGPFDWRSVVARGTMYFLEPAGGDRDREAYDHAVNLLREYQTEALTGGDPTPFRTSVFRIFVDEMNGRGARTAK